MVQGPLLIGETIQESSLKGEMRRRYLNYALSVITSRALPDVRDGLKPVQRRILYAMFANLHLYYGTKFRKSAAIVGEVLGKYHPHGDLAAYEAMARMAQPWVMRYPLAEGYGNFGSIDGDPPAAMRYTEVRLSALTGELFSDIRNDTVDFRPNYDGTTQEPVVLPASFPLLIVNGCSGIAVGMATSIPPHNIGEVISALIALIDNPEVDTLDLTRHIKGPDFPTGGIILNSKSDVRQIYKTGQGSIKLRGSYTIETLSRGRKAIIIDQIPYMVNKASLVEKIGELIAQKKVPQLIDVRDESTEDIRIVIEVKAQADAEAAIAYLFKNTSLQSTFTFNFNVLVPSERGTCVPKVIDLKSYLEYFLKFREDVVRRRLEYFCKQITQKLRYLEALKKAIENAREIIDILFRIETRESAVEKIKKLLDIDDEQAEYILETKIYRLSRPEAKKIQEDIRENKKELKRLSEILSSRANLLAFIKEELQAVAEKYKDKRRTQIGGDTELPEFDPEAYILHEDAFVIITANGWTKRQGSIKDLSLLRLREGDRVLSIVHGNTKEPVVFFSNYGVAYVNRIYDIPATTGYGDPVHKLYKLSDGEKIIAVFSLDPRAPLPKPLSVEPDDPPGPYFVTVTRMGYGFRFSATNYVESSSKSGRRFAKLDQGDEILGVYPVRGDEVVITAGRQGRVLLCPVGEINILSGPGRGVIVHKIPKEDELVGFGLSYTKSDGIEIETNHGRVEQIRPQKYKVSHRAGKGYEIIRRGTIVRVILPEVGLPKIETETAQAIATPEKIEQEQVKEKPPEIETEVTKPALETGDIEENIQNEKIENVVEDDEEEDFSELPLFNRNEEND